MAEPGFTLDEARAAMKVIAAQECADAGHAPFNVVRTMADTVGFWYCECGAVRWTGERVDRGGKKVLG